MAIINTTATPLISIPSPTIKGYQLTKLAASTVNGTTLYTLKTCGKSSDNKKYPICIYKTTNFSTKPVTTLIKIKDTNGKELGGLAKHANSITGIGSQLFVNTMNDANQPQCLFITTSGILKRKIYYKRNGVNSTFSSFNYVGKEGNYKKFILSKGSTSDGRRRYDFALLKGENLEYTGVSIIGTTIASEWTANDIFYQNGKLYTCFFKKNAKGIIAYNAIYCYNVNANTVIKTQVEPYDIIMTNKPSVFDKLYEVESFFIYNSKWYCAANCQSSKAAYNKDYIVKITKKK